MEKEFSFLDELILGTRILVNENIIDDFGHISVRDPRNPRHFWMIRENGIHSQPKTLLVELDLEGNPPKPMGLDLLLKDSSIVRFIGGDLM